MCCVLIHHSHWQKPRPALTSNLVYFASCPSSQNPRLRARHAPLCALPRREPRRARRHLRPAAGIHRRVWTGGTSKETRRVGSKYIKWPDPNEMYCIVDGKQSEHAIRCCQSQTWHSTSRLQTSSMRKRPIRALNCLKTTHSFQKIVVDGGAGKLNQTPSLCDFACVCVL